MSVLSSSAPCPAGWLALPVVCKFQLRRPRCPWEFWPWELILAGWPAGPGRLAALLHPSVAANSSPRAILGRLARQTVGHVRCKGWALAAGQPVQFQDMQLTCAAGNCASDVVAFNPEAAQEGWTLLAPLPGVRYNSERSLSAL